MSFVSSSVSAFRHYLLVVDAYSRWPCVVLLRSITSAAVISKMSRFFCDFGRPEELESDNGTQFASAEFREFCQGVGVKQGTSSPEYAQSNGLVKHHVQTVKKTLLKMFAEGETLWESLAAISSTPVSATLPTLSLLLQGRNLRGNLPFLPSELTPKLVLASVVTTELSARQNRATFNHTRPLSSRLSALLVGQLVWAYVTSR